MWLRSRGKAVLLNGKGMGKGVGDRVGHLGHSRLYPEAAKSFAGWR